MLGARERSEHGGTAQAIWLGADNEHTPEMEAVLRRILETLGAACLVTTLLAAPAIGQEDEFPNPFAVLLDAFESPQGQEFVVRFTRPPLPGSGSIEDPVGDLEHSTGQEPGFTPDHLDITSAWALELNPGPVDLFTPTGAGQIWAPTGGLEVDPPNYDPFHTFTGQQVHDGSQYESGALLFGFTLVGTPPADPPGRCEYVIWINDLERGDTFDTNPNFPLDPAGGTNLALGLALNPSDGPGLPSGFALELLESGGFAPIFEADVRAFVTPGYVGILAPSELVGEMASANFYTFCAEEGFVFEPEVSGADQTGLVDISADDLGIVRFEAQDLPPETTTTSTTEATTTTEPAPDTTIPVPASGDEPADEPADGPVADGFPWWLLLIAGGVGLVIAGWWVYNRDDDPCQELLEAWNAASEACDEAQGAADDAADACDSAELEIERLENERQELCKAWPPVCWETHDGDWIEDDQGRRITSRDIHMRKVALGDVWDDYRAGKLSASEVEEQWRQMDTPEFREDMRQTEKAFEEVLQEIEADLAGARQEVTKACERAEEAREIADEKCSEAAKARAAYEECAARAQAASGEPQEEARGGAPDEDPSRTGPAQRPAAPCEGREGEREVRHAGDPDTTRVFVDFSVITGVEEASARNVGAGERLVLDLNDLATELDFAGDLLNARSAGLHIGGAVNGYAAGKYTVTASGVIKGGADAAMATTDVVPDVPTTPLQVAIEGLESLSRLGGIIAGKVTEWMANVQIMTVRLTMFYQDITATPYEIWECRPDEGWVCTEQIWEIDVSRLKRVLGKDRSYNINSDVRRREFQRVIRGMSSRAASTVKRDAENLARWRAEHEAGPCR